MWLPCVVRLADADAAGDDAAVVLQHVVGELHVVDVGLQLDAAGAVAVAGREAEAVDPGRVEPGVSVDRWRRSYAVVVLRDDGEVGAAQDRRHAAASTPAYGACADDGRVEGRGVLLEEPAVDDRAVDVEPRVLRVAALELVRADDAAGAEALDLQRLPHEHVLVVDARRQHQQAAGGARR